VRNEGAAYITKGGELRNWYTDPDFCGRIYIGKEKNYQRFHKLRLEQRMASEQALIDSLNERLSDGRIVGRSYSPAFTANVSITAIFWSSSRGTPCRSCK
jgi:hypothetical protein